MKAIWSQSLDGIIGINGRSMPWHLPEDLKFFKEKTMGHTVVMGPRTYWSIPYRKRPLKGRENVVVSRHSQRIYLQGAKVLRDISLVPDDCFVIGGGTIYPLLLPRVDEVFVTMIDIKLQEIVHEWVSHAPSLENFALVDESEQYTSENGYFLFNRTLPVRYKFQRYVRKEEK